MTLAPVRRALHLASAAVAVLAVAGGCAVVEAAGASRVEPGVLVATVLLVAVLYLLAALGRFMVLLARLLLGVVQAVRDLSVAGILVAVVVVLLL